MINFNINEEELKVQIALGTADKKYLDPLFIISRQNSKIIAALIQFWQTARLPQEQQIEIADTLINHPYITKKDKMTMISKRNTIVFVREKFSELLTRYPKELNTGQRQKTARQRIRKIKGHGQ